jgi:hypothetical protein
MSTHLGSGGEQAPQAIIPVHPATSATAAGASAPADLLRHTLGFRLNSRHTLGYKVPSGRTLTHFRLQEGKHVGAEIEGRSSMRHLRRLAAITAALVVALLAGSGASAGAQTTAPKVAGDMPGVVTDWFYPDDLRWVEPNSNCLHGENTYISQVTSRWTTGQCRTPDPNYAGYFRYYDFSQGPDNWFFLVGNVGGYTEFSDRWSAATGWNVWFRYPGTGLPEGDWRYLEISATPPGQTTAAEWVNILDYERSDPANAKTWLTNDASARMAMLQLQLQTFNIWGNQHPYTTDTANGQTNSVGDAMAQTNIARNSFGQLLGTDPTDQQFHTAADAAARIAADQTGNMDTMEGQPGP